MATSSFPSPGSTPDIACVLGSDLTGCEDVSLVPRVHDHRRPDATEALAARAVLDALEHSVVYLDADYRVFSMNSRAALLLGGSTSLRVDRGRLYARCGRNQAPFESFLSTLAQARGTHFQFTHSVVLDGAEEGPSLRLIASPWKEEANEGIAYVLLLQECRPRVTISRATLMQSIFGLTPSQARLADLLFKGMPLKDAATLLRVTSQTARFQLKQIFHKTGAGRQSDLIRLMGQIPGCNPV